MFLVDTCVWSLSYRRDTPRDQPQVAVLRQALVGRRGTATTGLVLLELVRGFPGKAAREIIRADLSSTLWLDPEFEDYYSAAELITSCRRHGVQLGTVDAVIAQLAIRNNFTLLTTDADFLHAAQIIPLDVWRG